MKRVIEVRAAEGGDDAKLFASDLIAAYRRFCDRASWKVRQIAETAIEVEGDNLQGLINEVGGHRIQRIPPTERRGRVHTSTCTVAIIDQDVTITDAYRRRGVGDFRIEWFQSLGAGGQNANKHHNCCRIVHIPTGLKRECKGKSRESNLRQAKTSLVNMLDTAIRDERHGKIATDRKQQVGTGQRGDKRRTYRFQEDRVRDDITGKSARLSEVLTGRFDLLW